MSIFDGLSLDVSKIVNALKQEVANLTEHKVMVTAAAETYKEKYEAAQVQVVELQAQVTALQAQLPGTTAVPAEGSVQQLQSVDVAPVGKVAEVVPVEAEVAPAPAAGQVVPGMTVQDQTGQLQSASTQEVDPAAPVAN